MDKNVEIHSFFVNFLCKHLTKQKHYVILYTGDNNVKERNFRTIQRNNGFRI